MSDNNKFSLSVGLKQLYIIKHALQLYLKREASEQDKKSEERLLNQVNKQIGTIREEYHI